MTPFVYVVGRLEAPRIVRAAFLASTFAVLAGCGSTSPPPPPPPAQVGNIAINGIAPFTLERGYHLTLKTTVLTTTGAVTTAIPVVFTSLKESVVTVDAQGRLFGVDTGLATVYASALTVNSPPVLIHVVQSIESIAPSNFAPFGANSPGSSIDSVRAFVSNHAGQPVANVRVSFAVTGGGGSITPAIVPTNAAGVAAAEWKLGAAVGVNTAQATILGENDAPYTLGKADSAVFSVRTFNALSPVTGDNQTGQILSNLPVQPAVKLVDSAGKVRPGVPITFQATAGGKVAFITVSTGADGIASPGNWTLGDITGAQNLVVTVENATLLLKATGTGTAIHYQPLNVAAGTFATCAVNTDNTASCWGEQPKVGNGGTANAPLPTVTSGGFTYKAVYATPSSVGHICAIGTDQGVYCWGQNSYPDTTTGTKTFSTTIPTKEPTSLLFTQVAPGQAHNCALGVDQAVYCWGDNSFGQLGDRSLTTRPAPGVVFGGFKYSAITSGTAHSCGLAVDGSVVCWGANQFGQLGNGTIVNSSSPTIVSGGLTFVSLHAGDSFTCGLTNQNTVFCWGGLVSGNSSVPRAYPTAPNFTSIAVGGLHACALTSDGTAYCWGSNSLGQLGDSTKVDRPNPVQVVTSLKFKSLTGGYQHTCGQTQDNSVACWGSNKAFELADSTVTSRTLPRFIVLGVLP